MPKHEMSQRQALSTLSVSPPPGSLAALVQREQAGGGATCRLGNASCATAHASRLHRSAIGDGTMLHRSLRRLQRDYGNQFVGQVLRQATGGHEEGGMDAVERSIDAARGGGQGLDHATQRRMESSFGADFSGVRIHHDARSDGLSQSLSARAFATGRDVFFRQGEYNPGTSSGRELLAHELTHVVQQNGAGVQRKMTVSEPGDPHEVEADRMAQHVMAQEHVQRQPEVPKVTEEDEKGLGKKASEISREEEEKMD